MKYSELFLLLDTLAGRKKLDKLLSSPNRNRDIDIFRDYYDGYQWQLGLKKGMETRTTRSGTEMWKVFDSQKPGRGFTEGELKVWNIGKPAIDVFKRYTRGIDTDDVKVVDKDGGEIEGIDIFGDINEFTIDATERMSIDSVLVTKFNPDDSDQVLNAIAKSGGEGIERVEIIDAKTIEPLYWKGAIRGYLRFYGATPSAVMEAIGGGLDLGESTKEKLYIEVWHIQDNGGIELIKLYDAKEIERGSYSYDFLPFYIEGNSESCIDRFDLDHVEYSDIGDLISLQDDMNKHLTTITKIFDTVAFPILTLDETFWEMMKGKSPEEVKDQLESISIIPGGITSVPLNRLPAEGISPTQDTFIDRILTQFYMTTGIPKSIFNSEGLSNTSGSAMAVMTESLRRKVSDKRTRIARVIKHNVRLSGMVSGGELADVDVNFPDMIEMTADDRIRILESSSNSSLLPKEYIAKSMLELLGDEESVDEIVGQIVEQDAKSKADIEAALARSQDKRAKEQDQKRTQELSTIQAQINAIP